MGYTPPNYPARPVPETETLMSVMDDLADSLGIAYDPSKAKKKD
jgi:hypothetical protein